jgi:excisionase family DNA binding protein
MSNRRNKKSAVVAPEVNSQTNQARGLPVIEAARYLGTTVCFVRSIIHSREIKALLLGRRHILLKDDLDAYLETQRRRA